MLHVRPATESDIPAIQQIAYDTWPSTYNQILSQTQIDYMLELMYNSEILKAQMTQKAQVFCLALRDYQPLGFVAYEVNYQHSTTTKIHKIYILPQAQGQGVGKMLLNAAEEAAKKNANNALILNVNKFNKAVSFYERVGFQQIDSEILEIGNGFVMDDFVMQKML